MPRNMVSVPAANQAQKYRAPEMRLGRSQIPLSHNHKTTFDAGFLVPYFLVDVVPGDTMVCKLLAFARIFSPLDAPIMDNIEMSIDFFFVPNRIIWDNWEAFLGAHDAAGAQDTTYTIPVLSDGITVAVASTAHYMGVPIGLSTTAEPVSALPYRAYRLIYNEWYRDQNLINSVAVPMDDGPDGLIGVLKSAKKHDYFTSALPYLQKGSVQFVPLTGTMDVQSAAAVGEEPSVVVGGSRRPFVEDTTRIEIDGGTGVEAQKLFVDLADITTGFSINALREAAAIQRLLERDARGGTRHPELIRAHFGVDVPDMRTQRPEYLGGGRGYINVSPVANTSATATEDQGQLAGVGTGTLRASWAKSFVEHGYVLGILRARADVSYQQGLERHWSRSTKYDFLWPELAHLGEQPIYNKELFIVGDATDDDVFGYQERYADYRFKKSLITGKLASDAAGSLDFWHLAEDFSGQPALNQTFIEDASPMARVTTVDSEPDFIIDGRFDLRVARALPVRPVPTLAPARF